MVINSKLSSDYNIDVQIIIIKSNNVERSNKNKRTKKIAFRLKKT